MREEESVWLNSRVYSHLTGDFKRPGNEHTSVFRASVSPQSSKVITSETGYEYIKQIIKKAHRAGSSSSSPSALRLS